MEGVGKTFWGMPGFVVLTQLKSIPATPEYEKFSEEVAKLCHPKC
jgi:hypothetical protein